MATVSVKGLMSLQWSVFCVCLVVVVVCQEREKERERRLREKMAEEERMREWSRPREDMDLDDLIVMTSLQSVLSKLGLITVKKN